ncbi:MAG: 50S ribosomal protein L21 [Thermoleophilaceae bacterium]|nr:50S ribosomal protein L21 [Thermoleophilaceae bacterium]
MYAIVKVGGKQYRVEKGDSLLVDRMPEDEGAKVVLEPLLFAPDGKDEPVFGGDDLGKVKVEAKITGHERGPKIHVLKFKPKRGYKRRQGHRSELTRLEIGDIGLPGRKAPAAAEKPAATKKPAAAKKEPTTAGNKPTAAAKKPSPKKPAVAEKPVAAKKPPAAKPKKPPAGDDTKTQEKERSDGS